MICNIWYASHPHPLTHIYACIHTHTPHTHTHAHHTHGHTRTHKHTHTHTRTHTHTHKTQKHGKFRVNEMIASHAREKPYIKEQLTHVSIISIIQ